MAANEFAVVSFTAAAGAGNKQQITSPLITNWKSAILFLSGAPSEDAADAPARQCVGVVDSAGTQHVYSISLLDGQTTTATRTEAGAQSCLRIRDEGTTLASDGDAIFSAALSNGVEIEWTTTPTEAYKGFAVLFGGDLVSLVGEGNATTVSATKITNIDEASFYILVCADIAFGAGLSNNLNGRWSIGAVVNDGVFTQHSTSAFFDNGAADGDSDGIIKSNRVGVGYPASPTPGAINVTDIVNNGFVRVANAGSPDYLWLGVKLAGGYTAKMAIESLPVATGVKHFTGLGVQPVLAFQFCSLLTATSSSDADALTDGDTASAWGMGAFTEQAQYAHGFSNDDGAATSVTRSYASASSLVLQNADGTLAARATMDGFTSSGVKLNFSSAVAGTMVLLGIIPPPAEQPGIHRRPKPQRQRGAAVRQRKPQAPGGHQASSIVRHMKEFVRQRVQRILRLRQPRFVPTVAAEEIERVNADEQGVIQEGGAVRGAIFEGGAEEGTIVG